MALTYTEVKEALTTMGKLRVRTFDVTGDNSYPAGGYTVDLKGTGFTGIYGIQVIGGNPAANRQLCCLDTTSSKLMVLHPSGGGTAAGAALADPAITAGGTAVTSAAANGATDLTAGRGREITAATDITSLTFRIMFIGR